MMEVIVSMPNGEDSDFRLLAKYIQECQYRYFPNKALTISPLHDRIAKELKKVKVG